MAITRKRIGTNPDGSDHFLYELNGAEHVVATGPAIGLVQLADGTLYDVTDHYIEVATPEHATEVADKIHDQHIRRGTPGIEGKN